VANAIAVPWPLGAKRSPRGHPATMTKLHDKAGQLDRSLAGRGDACVARLIHDGRRLRRPSNHAPIKLSTTITGLEGGGIKGWGGKSPPPLSGAVPQSRVLQPRSGSFVRLAGCPLGDLSAPSDQGDPIGMSCNGASSELSLLPMGRRTRRPSRGHPADTLHIGCQRQPRAAPPDRRPFPSVGERQH